MSVENIKKKLEDFIKKISKISEKKLSRDKVDNISKQAVIFANLLDGEGFFSESEEMKSFAVTVSRNSKVTRSQIKVLNDILNIIELE